MVDAGVVEIVGSKIAKVDRRAGPVTHDLGAVTLMPGLIDVHVHLGYIAWPDPKAGALEPLASFRSDALLSNARSTLLAGFTTVQSLGGDDRPLRDAIAAGIVVGPRVVTAVRQIWGLKWTPDELRAQVRAAKADGADVIKFMASGVFLAGGKMNVTPEQLEAVCVEAKRQALSARAKTNSDFDSATRCNSSSAGRRACRG
ncbi:MAG: amidohydrolase family protein [Opitutaceae bacterium]|nr:amidohydrolase family protein [Opitutaceae bacterium]